MHPPSTQFPFWEQERTHQTFQHSLVGDGLGSKAAIAAPVGRGCGRDVGQQLERA